MTRAERVTRTIRGILSATIESGQQPLRVILSVGDYRALVERDGLEPRSIGKTRKDTLRVRLLGFDLPADASKAEDDGEPCVTGCQSEPAAA